VASALNKDDEDQSKKKKQESEAKAVASKKRKASTPKQKLIDEEEKTSATSSATEIEEILKVMTETLPIKLSPLGLHLTKLFHKEKEPTKTKAPRPKRQRIVTVTEVIEATPPRASAPKVPAIESTTATEAALSEATDAEATRAKDINLESVALDIDKILLDMVAEEAAGATEEASAPEAEKKKEIAEETLEDEIFNFQNLVGQELTKAEKEELKEYAISCGYRPGALLFGGVDDEKLGCIRDQTGAKVIGTLSKSIGFPKLEADISRYRRQHICRRFETGGSLGRRVKCRRVPQPRWVGTRRSTKGGTKGGRQAKRGNPRPSCCPAPRSGALAVGGYKCPRGRERGTLRVVPSPRAANPL
jgi:hypothetical protein